MNINELRIGNLVTDQWYESFKTILKVESINENGINLQIEDDGNWSECAQRWIGEEYKIGEIYPIPLTKELLDKTNLEKVDFYYHIYKGRYEVTPMAKPYWGIWLGKIESLPDTQEFMTGIEYLHELQNIYFALTSTELEINL